MFGAVDDRDLHVGADQRNLRFAEEREHVAAHVDVCRPARCPTNTSGLSLSLRNSWRYSPPAAKPTGPAGSLNGNAVILPSTPWNLVTHVTDVVAGEVLRRRRRVVAGEEVQRGLEVAAHHGERTRRGTHIAPPR